MNALFEGFLTGVVLRHRSEILPNALQDARIIVQGEDNSRPLLIRDSTGRGTLMMKPDMLLKLDMDFPVILDFKYKVLDIKKPRAGVGREDLYQMFAYAQIYQSPKIVLVYPQIANVNTSTLQYHVPPDGGSPARLKVGTVNLSLNLYEDGIKTVVDDLKYIFVEV